MKKVFLIEPEHVHNNEYYSIVMVADSAQEALEIAKKGKYFSDDQGELVAEEIDMTHSRMIFSSFCAG